jgi:citronellol/citronellal dehydrogenase
METANDPHKGRVAFITGGSRGIGKAIAIALAERGCRIVTVGKTMQRTEGLDGSLIETAEEIRSKGGAVDVYQCDVRNDEALGTYIDRTVEVYGRIDYMICNAGALHWQPLEKTPVKKFDLVMGVNARAAYACAYHALPHMRKQRYGHILMLSPRVDPKGAEGKIAYAISKFGMTLIAQGLAAEVRGENIAANALWPVTMIRTAAVEKNNLGGPAMWRTPEIVVDAVLAILAKEPRSFTGNVVSDEAVLATAGVADFTKYRCDPAHEPPRVPFDFKVNVG